MTTVISCDNVNGAFVEGMWKLKTSGILEKSRNGPVMVMPGPVVTEYRYPMERVLFHPGRDANPVFHLMESLWMLAGSNHMDFLLPFNSGMARYAEDDGTMHGAYGYRWRQHFRRDQLLNIVDELGRDPSSRQAVLAMWDPAADLNYPEFKDRPCNTHAYFDLRGGRLNMTVCCRSNDMVWGAYGANVVHFSVLQEWLAAALGVGVGMYRQISNNFHLYTDNPQCRALFAAIEPEAYDPYRSSLMPRLPMVTDALGFIADCERLVFSEEAVRGQADNYETPFFRTVAAPLYSAYLGRRGGKPIDWGRIADCDWKLAFQEWVSRRDAPSQATD